MRPTFVPRRFARDHALRHALAPAEAWRWLFEPTQRPEFDTWVADAAGCAEQWPRRGGAGAHHGNLCRDRRVCEEAGNRVMVDFLRHVDDALAFAERHPEWTVHGRRARARFEEQDCVAPTGLFVAVGEGVVKTAFRPSEVDPPAGDSAEDLRLDRLARVWRGLEKLRGHVAAGGAGPSRADLEALQDAIDAHIVLGPREDGGPISRHAALLCEGEPESAGVILRMETP